MARYVKQKDMYSCGPVVIMNVLKWAGVKFSYQEKIGVLREVCGCKPGRGTSHPNLDQALRWAVWEVEGKLRIRRVRRPKLCQIEKHLGSGGVVVLNYAWKRADKGDRHYTLLTGVSRSGQYFWSANSFTTSSAVNWHTRDELKADILRFQRTDPKCKAWFISFKN